MFEHVFVLLQFVRSLNNLNALDPNNTVLEHLAGESLALSKDVAWPILYQSCVPLGVPILCKKKLSKLKDEKESEKFLG